MSVQQLAAAVEEIQTQTNRVTSEAIAAKKRLPELERAIAESIASADAGLVRELRSERQDLECVVHDAEAAERVLLQKLEGAQRELAVQQLPEARREAENARDQLEESAERTRTAVQAHLDARRNYLRIRNQAHREEAHLFGDIPLQTSLSGSFVRLVRDGFGAV